MSLEEQIKDMHPMKQKLLYFIDTKLYALLIELDSFLEDNADYYDSLIGNENYIKKLSEDITVEFLELLEEYYGGKIEIK